MKAILIVTAIALSFVSCTEFKEFTGMREKITKWNVKTNAKSELDAFYKAFAIQYNFEKAKLVNQGDLRFTQTPAETEELGNGICGDIALYALELLHNLDASKPWRFAIIKLKGKKAPHALLEKNGAFYDPHLYYRAMGNSFTGPDGDIEEVKDVFTYEQVKSFMYDKEDGHGYKWRKIAEIE